MNPRVLVAPDAFKSSISAADAAHHLAQGLASAGCVPIECPIADGGEGTVSVLESLGATVHSAKVTGALGRSSEAVWAELDGSAYVEVAQGSGAHQVPVANAATCLAASSTGVGQLILAALDAGHRHIVLTTGGSGVSDGGAGMLSALGARFWPPRAGISGGGSLSRVLGVDLSALDPRLRTTELVLAVDVRNPLLGAEGAARTFAPQKGAGPEQVEILEAGLAHWADLVESPEGARYRGTAGSGASGGIGFAALAALGARPVSGADLVLDLLGVDARLQEAGLVVTGEGALDRQSTQGKAPLALAQRALKHRVPVAVVAGRVELSPRELGDAGISASWSLVELAGSAAAAMAEPGQALEKAGRRVADWALGRGR
ncbi:glycerate kinase [Sinomonas sp. G460-2]|uniref:glycerate kinase n=1 Tax=Sinomonas sp. G460-2 TaxID=3393464 RepID=UPI0039EE8BE3